MAEERKRNELEALILAFRDAEPEERTAMNAALTQNEAGILDGFAQDAAAPSAAAMAGSGISSSAGNHFSAITKTRAGTFICR